jgi:hypothetical protein
MSCYIILMDFYFQDVLLSIIIFIIITVIVIACCAISWPCNVNFLSKSCSIGRETYRHSRRGANRIRLASGDKRFSTTAFVEYSLAGGASMSKLRQVRQELWSIERNEKPWIIV